MSRKFTYFWDEKKELRTRFGFLKPETIKILKEKGCTRFSFVNFVDLEYSINYDEVDGLPVKKGYAEHFEGIDGEEEAYYYEY